MRRPSQPPSICESAFTEGAVASPRALVRTVSRTVASSGRVPTFTGTSERPRHRDASDNEGSSGRRENACESGAYNVPITEEGTSVSVQSATVPAALSHTPIVTFSSCCRTVTKRHTSRFMHSGSVHEQFYYLHHNTITMTYPEERTASLIADLKAKLKAMQDTRTPPAKTRANDHVMATIPWRIWTPTPATLPYQTRLYLCKSIRRFHCKIAGVYCFSG
ncbi:hypothetical protein THAOC_27575 [Thalassiosira oceanica]|uniref:Uncharacterized protein n=1 Tax=Thalassiosira oceanica TaxID=159749 RepID=K0RW37_THAOC|nr:hypothetical protein THAOC_27575 [Thalassiosira oceanica]|eukprot:EJK53056.1 hypothetical protein THAOC_27575 [Thalassiosira oceanica]